MKWLKIRIKTTTAATDIIISNLYDIGLEGAQIEDNQPLTALEKEQMFVDVMPVLPKDDGIAYLNFFVEISSESDVLLTINNEEIERSLLLEKISAEMDTLKEYNKSGDFIDIGEGSLAVSETEDLDWINNWKQYFHQFAIDDILIVPSWEEIKDPKAWNHILRIDPGTAFGTGMHETTQLCIRQLRKYIKHDDSLLDVGCGSGILAILALKFGAKQAYGTDLDPCALEAVKENRHANGVSAEQLKIMIGNIINDEKVFHTIGGADCYDIVVANILAEILVPLTPVAYRCLKKGGLFITSGIIGEQASDRLPPKAEQVIAVMRASGMELKEISYMGAWVSITAQKA